MPDRYIPRHEQIPAITPDPDLMKRLAARGIELYHPPRPPVNPYLSTYAARLAGQQTLLPDGLPVIREEPSET